MMLFGSCIGDGERFAAVAGPSIERIRHPDDVVLTDDGGRGICSAYNRFLDAACELPACEGVVLMHDDVEVLDAHLRRRLARALGDPDVGVAGLIGAADLVSGQWWQAQRLVGRVFESRGPVVWRTRSGPVDVVDGLLLALSMPACRQLRFDETRFPAFHGYDLDICLQARAAGMFVKVVKGDVIHRTKGGFGDKAAWDAAEAALVEKWPQFIRPRPPQPPVGGDGPLRRLRLSRLRRKNRRLLVHEEHATP